MRNFAPNVAEFSAIMGKGNMNETYLKLQQVGNKFGVAAPLFVPKALIEMNASRMQGGGN